MPAECRTVIKSKRFEKELRGLANNPRRADEFVFAVEFALARNPSPVEATCIQENPPVWFIPCTPFENVAVFYGFDDDSVTLLSIIH